MIDSNHPSSSFFECGADNQLSHSSSAIRKLLNVREDEGFSLHTISGIFDRDDSSVNRSALSFRRLSKIAPVNLPVESNDQRDVGKRRDTEIYLLVAKTMEDPQ
jgi:hypothetical protein